MVFKLCEWETVFPDGVSLATYRRIGRMIRRYGNVIVRMELDSDPHGALSRALDKIEKRK